MKLWRHIVNCLAPVSANGADASKAHISSASPSGNENTANQPQLLSQLDNYTDLLQLLDKRQLVEVFITAEPYKRYSSMLLHLDFTQQLLWLDNIEGFANMLSPGQSLRLRHHQHGYELDITSTIVFVANGGIAIQLPSNAKYRSRRQTPRVTLRPDSPLMIKLKPFYVPAWDGTVRNLSSRGARFALAGNQLHQLKSHQHIPWLEIPISPGFSVRCEGRITGFQFVTKPYRHTCVSLVFEKLKPETQRQLEQFVIGLRQEPRHMAA